MREEMEGMEGAAKGEETMLFILLLQVIFSNGNKWKGEALRILYPEVGRGKEEGRRS